MTVACKAGRCLRKPWWRRGWWSWPWQQAAVGNLCFERGQAGAVAASPIPHTCLFPGAEAGRACPPKRSGGGLTLQSAPRAHQRLPQRLPAPWMSLRVLQGWLQIGPGAGQAHGAVCRGPAPLAAHSYSVPRSSGNLPWPQLAKMPRTPYLWGSHHCPFTKRDSRTRSFHPGETVPGAVLEVDEPTGSERQHKERSSAAPTAKVGGFPSALGC